jgi:hypothetical protein
MTRCTKKLVWRHVKYIRREKEIVMCVKFSIPERLAAAQMHYLVYTNSEYVVFGNENSVLRVTM